MTMRKSGSVVLAVDLSVAVAKKQDASQSVISPQEMPQIARIRSYLAGLEKGAYSRDSRFMLWRLIINSARDAYEAELAELDSLNALKCDPILTSAAGALVE